MPVLDADFIQELQMQKEPKWHQEGRSNTRQHWAKAKVRNIARSFLWGSIALPSIFRIPNERKME